MAEAAAKLGFQVITGDLEKGRVALDKLTESAGKTETSASQMSRAMTNAGKVFSAAALGMTRSVESLVYSLSSSTKESREAATQARRFSESVYEAASAQEALASSVEKTTKAIANQNRQMKKSGQTAETKGTNRFYTGNIVAQFQDIGVTAAMGMNPLTIAIQQGTQLSAILESMERPLAGIAAGFKALISPVTLLTVGLTALSVVGLQTVDWANATQKALNALANGMDIVADHIDKIIVPLSLFATTALPLIGTGFANAAVALGGLTKAAIAFVASNFLIVIGGLAQPLVLVSAAIIGVSGLIIALTKDISFLQGTLEALTVTINKAIGSVSALFAALFGIVNLFRGGSWKDVGNAMKDAFNDDYIKKFSDAVKDAANGIREYNKTTEEIKNPWESIDKYTYSTLENLQLELSLIGKEAKEVERLRYQFELRNRAIAEGLDVTDEAVSKRIKSQVDLLTAAKMDLLEAQTVTVVKNPWELIDKYTYSTLENLQFELSLIGKETKEVERLRYQFELTNRAIAEGLDITDESVSSRIKTQADLLTAAKMDLLEALQKPLNLWESLEDYSKKTLASIELETKLLHAEGIEAERLRYQFELKNRAIESGLDITQKDVVARLSVMTSELTAAKKAFLTAQETKAYDDFIAGTRKSVDALRDQERQLFMTSEELATYKAKMDLVNQATSKGISLGPERMKTIEELSIGIGQQKANYEKLSSSINTATSLTSGFFIDMKNGLAQGQSAWEAFGTAVTNVLNNIADALIQLATQQAVLGIAANMMAPAVSNKSINIGSGNTMGLGNTVPSQTGTLDIGASSMSILHPSAKGNVFTNSIVDNPTVFKFAKGSRFGVMGEAGPEAVMPLTRSADGSLGVRSVGNSQEAVVVNVINNSNATARTEERQTTHGKEIDVIIDQLVSQKINQQGSSTNRALTAYSNQKLISR